MLCHPWAISASGWVVGLPIPRHQLVDALLRPAVDEACVNAGEKMHRRAGVKMQQGPTPEGPRGGLPAFRSDDTPGAHARGLVLSCRCDAWRRRVSIGVEN